MKRILSILLTILAILFLCTGALAEEVPVYHAVPFPDKKAESGDFCIAEDGSLMVTVDGKTLIYQGGTWKKADLQPRASSLTVMAEQGKTLVVSKDNKPIYTEDRLQTIYPFDDKTAYGTNNNKVYRVDMTTGSLDAICYVEGWEFDDWAQRVLLSGNMLYIIQTYIPLIQGIDLDAAQRLGQQFLKIALSSNMDIGNAVLSTAEELFLEQHLNTIVDMTKVTPDQLRLDLMSDPARYDLIVCEPMLWNDLAQAGVFEDMEKHAPLKDAWQLWTDMSSLCRYQERLMGVPLWDNSELLWVNDSLAPLLKDIQWPNPDWTWNDFLALARTLSRDMNGDGSPDIYIAYQRMFYAAHDIVRAYSLPVHQAAILYQNGRITDMQCPEALSMLSVWKTCMDENLLYPADGYYEEPHRNMVVFPSNALAEWCEYAQTVDIRLAMPGLSDTLYCNPADSVMMSINTHSNNMDKAVAFMEAYMRYGADEHDYLKEHTHTPTELLPYQKVWKAPTEFHDSHYVAALENTYRDTWDMSLYDDMELQLSRYLSGQITAEECARLWQEKLRMTQME